MKAITLSASEREWQPGSGDLPGRSTHPSEVIEQPQRSGRRSRLPAQVQPAARKAHQARRRRAVRRAHLHHRRRLLRQVGKTAKIPRRLRPQSGGTQPRRIHRPGNRGRRAAPAISRSSLDCARAATTPGSKPLADCASGSNDAGPGFRRQGNASEKACRDERSPSAAKCARNAPARRPAALFHRKER